MSYEKVTVRGQILNHVTGDPLSGEVVITPSKTPVTDAEGNILLYGKANVRLDETGFFEVELPASQDSGLDPNDFQYSFKVVADGGVQVGERTVVASVANATEVEEDDGDGGTVTRYIIEFASLWTTSEE